MKKPCSEKFLEAVKKNLPPPELSGPKTKLGKGIVRHNSVSHGLFCESFLSCRKKQCYYYDVCRVRYVLSEEEFNRLPINGICLNEFAEYNNIMKALAKSYDMNDESTKALVEDYAMSCVRAMRADNFTLLNPELGLEYDDYYNRLNGICYKLKNKKIKLSKQLLQL